MICPTCGGDNESGRRFCGDCGAPLALACGACGSANSPRARFCGECGTPLVAGAVPTTAAATPASPLTATGLTQPPGTPAAATPTQPGSPLTERRLVSVLFADLVGFTTLAEARDSEEVRDLLSRYFDTCQTMVTRYGGVVEKFIGDAVMAVWGAPVANEDDAERAVRAALDLVDSVAQLGLDVGVADLRARAGVLTGEATVNLGAVRQGMVAGDMVSTASRLQGVAAPGTVVVGETTKRATDAAIAYTDDGVHTLKGRVEPVHVWQAHRVIAGVGGLMRSEGLEPPFVGRDREIKLVKELFHASTDEGRAHLLQVTGIAGIGKSRLGWEFFKYMDGLRRVFRWHRGRCLAYGEGVTYWALAEMVRSRCGILEGEDRVVAATKLRETVEQFVPDPADRRFVEPRLAHLLGLEERSVSDKGDLFAGWRLFFERLAASDPVVMVFEDLQWADRSLVEFIEHLLEWSRSLPIFVMTMARPGGETSFGGARRNATSLYLEPLSPRAMEQLLTGLVPGLPVDAKAKILARAEGVPLYAVETVRMLLDRGLLVQEGTVYRLTGAFADLDVPETLHALIAARLDGLNAAERRLVQDAAVLGKTCSRAALAAVSGISERDLDPILAGLLAKEVLIVQADPRSPERGQYGFVQDLVRTVAYEMLSRRDRKAKHLVVAAYLQSAWGAEEEEIVEVVASHLAEAYRLDPEADDAPEIRARARGMLVRAGERAASLAAAAEAEAYFTSASALADSAEEQGLLAERAGEMAVLRGRLDAAAERFEESRARLEESGQPHAAARVEARLAEVAFRQHHLDLAIDRMRTAHARMAGDAPDRDMAMVAGQFGRFLAIAGRDVEAIPLIEEALQLAEHLELREVFAQALSSRAIGLVRQARFDEAQTLLRRAVEVALEHDLPAAVMRAWNNLAVVLEAQDRFAEAVAVTTLMLETARRKGDRATELTAITGALTDLVSLGRWDEAIAQGDEAAGEELDALPVAKVGLVDLVRIHVRRGELDAAGALVDELASLGAALDESGASFRWANAEYLRAVGRPAEVVAMVKQDLDPLIASLGLPAPGTRAMLVHGVEAAIDAGDLAAADELLDIVHRALPGLVAPQLRAQVASLGARLAIVRGESDAVEPGLATALHGFRFLEMPFEIAATLVVWAEWLHGQGRANEATPLVVEARAIFENLGARPWLRRLDALNTGDVVRDAAQVPAGGLST